MSRTTHSLWVPDEGEVLAVVRVTADGESQIVTYMSQPPDDLERELDAIQQRWTWRWTWPGDEEGQEGARIHEYVRHPEDEAFLRERGQLKDDR